MKKLLPLLTAALLLPAFVYCQGTVRGKIVDSSTTRPLGLATITIFKASDTAIITYRLSTPEGEFKVSGIPLDLPCRMVISYSGFSVFRKDFTIPSSQPTYETGTIQLSPDAKSLDEVLLVAERPPVIVKKDTIEFNASSFKTLPNALVEDLLKKLPGVMVDKDGNITVNGKPVNRMLVDGKVFFGDDPKMATRNLPANVIDKVQVTDDKEEMMRNGDDNPNNVGKVVNITLKKGVKKGWFGKLYAGAGTDERYEAGGIANIYRDTLQLSVLGYSNNLNRTGFSYSELMSSGGFERVRSNSASNNTSIWTNNGGNGISINGINFGGAQSFGGISRSNGVGFNLNLAPNKKNSYFLQYFHGNVRAPRISTTDINQYNSDTIINSNTRLTGDFVTYTNNMGLGMRLKPDSVTNILFNANYLIGKQDEDRFSTVSGNNNKIGPLSKGTVNQFNDADMYWYRHTFSLTLLSKSKKGRRFNFNQNLDINNRYNDYTSESAISYYYPTTFDSVYAQLRKERLPRTDASTMANFSEPVSKHLTIRTTGRWEYSKFNNEVSTFNRASGGSKFEVFNALLSNDFRRISNRYFLTTGLEYKWKDLAITPNIRIMQQSIDNKLITKDTILKQRRFDLLPVFTIVYKQLNFSYQRDVVMPAFNYINPVTDVSNPYFITKGNSNLLPIVRNAFSLNYYYNDAKRYLNVGGYVSANFSNNDIVQSYVVDARGVQTTIPVNVNGSKNYSMNWNINKQYKNKNNRTFMWNTGNWMGVNKNRLLYNGVDSWQTTFNYNHWFGVGLNLNDIFEWNISYSFSKNFTRYTSKTFRELNIIGHYGSNEFVLRWPKHFIWETQVNYSYNGSIPAGMPKDAIRWNAGLNYTMLKNEAGVIKFSVNDILNQNNNIWVSANRNTITTSESNLLKRYFLLTFTYNVRPSGASKKVGGQRLFFF